MDKYYLRCAARFKFRPPSIQYFSLRFFLFLPNTDIACYGDDNTPYAMNESTNEVVREIKMTSEWFFNWFQNTSIKANPDNFHLLLIDTDTNRHRMEVCYKKFENSFCKSCYA